MRASRMRRGALPGRNPGMRTSRAMRRNAASIALSNSVSSTSTETLTLLSSRDSTALFTDQGAYRRAESAPPGQMGRTTHACVARAARASLLGALRLARTAHGATKGSSVPSTHVSGNRAMLREEDFAGGSGVGLVAEASPLRSSLAGPGLHRLGPVQFPSARVAVADRQTWSAGEWRSGSAPALGAGGRGFKSPLPDQL